MSILSKAYDKIVRLGTYNNLGRTETTLWHTCLHKFNSLLEPIVI